jgi:hypothetical protein
MSIEFRHSLHADALYVRFADRPVAYTEDISRNGYYERGVDYADDDTPVGVEFLGVSRGVDLTDVPRAAEIAAMLREHHIRELA